MTAPTFTPPTLVLSDSPNGSQPDATPAGCSFAWEAPPEALPRGRAATAGTEQIEWFNAVALPQLQANPGQYAKVFNYAKRSSASTRVKRLREQHPGVTFVSRSSGTVAGQATQPEWSAVYAAWVDGGEDVPPAE